MVSEPYLTATEVVEQFGISQDSLELLVNLGLLTPIYISGRPFFKSEELHHLESLFDKTSAVTPAGIITDLYNRVKKLEQAVSVISSIVKPSVYDVLHGLTDDQLMEILQQAISIGSNKPELSVVDVEKWLKILSNIDKSTLEILRSKTMKVDVWKVFVKLLQHIESQYHKRLDPSGKLNRLLKSARENLRDLIVIDTGQVRDGIFVAHPRRLLISILRDMDPR